MPGDFSRKLFDKKKHYSGVLMQQGRVQLDADWNEELDIEQYRTFTETKDVIGAAGVPKKNGGFKISVSANGSDLVIAPGRIYVEGLLCEQEKDPVATYKSQPYYPSPDLSLFAAPTSPAGSPPGSPPAPLLKDGSYIVYLKAWQRELNYLDDPYIQEKALGEADTTTRLQTVWQVRLLKVADNGTGKCSSQFPEWDALTAPVTGKLNAQTKPPQDDSNPCLLPASAGYLRLENQLYRVQVQVVDNARKVQTFKWSRDNASIETTMEVIGDKVIRVADLGKDDVLGFAGNQWAEIVDDVSALGGKPNKLVQIDAIDPDSREVTLKTSVIQFQSKKNLKLRRWDMGSPATQDGLTVSPGWQDIEDGIQVSFDNGTFEEGDYWLIPARTATGDIEWKRSDPGQFPLPQSRIGTQYFYCRLAFAKVVNGSIKLEDCRDLFPSLTDICAEDICFNNTNCKFPGSAQNVQEALDLLCAANDLRDHNKNLHGYGVVGGLKVICGSDRNFVRVERGYALDCEGNVVRNRYIQNFNVIAAATAAGIQLKGTTAVCISIAYNGGNAPILSIEPFVKKNFWDEILEGTLLKDFLDGCIKSLIDALKSELALPVKQQVPVPIGQRRLTALINLLAQMINKQSGQYAYLSGDKKKKHDPSLCKGGKVEDKDEDELLYCFYERLKVLLSSETYCGQIDHQPFPAYTLDPGLNTIFGTPFKIHRRLRISAQGDFAYTCTGDGRINVYNLKTEEFERWLDFPATNAQVQDIYLTRDGKKLHAVALVNNKDSAFATVTLSGAFSWQGPFIVPDMKFVSIGSSIAKERLIGVAVAKGLFDINLTALAVAPKLIQAFNATGMLAFSDDGNQAFAAENTGVTTESTTFDNIRTVNLATGGQGKFAINGLDADNDLMFHNGAMYVTGNLAGAAGRMLTGQIPNGTIQPVLLGNTNSFLRLAAVTQNSDISIILVSFSDESKVLKVNAVGSRLTLEPRFRIPVQLFPMGIGNSDSRSGTVYVLNSLPNTLTTIDVQRVLLGAQPNFTADPPHIIADYREAVLEAYKSLFMRLLQYLKDCFCDKFLIDCPTCTDKDKVYLGTIEIRDGQIFHICNFSKRKYVKTFRTVDYWMSVVPVMPVLKKAFTVFCCAVLDDLGKKSSTATNK